MEMNKNNCRVCGFYNDEPPWGEDGNTPTYEICACCGVEFGNEDYTYESVKRYRKIWIDKGYPWFDRKKRPLDWNFEGQFKNVPNGFL